MCKLRAVGVVPFCDAYVVVNKTCFNVLQLITLYTKAYDNIHIQASFKYTQYYYHHDVFFETRVVLLKIKTLSQILSDFSTNSDKREQFKKNWLCYHFKHEEFKWTAHTFERITEKPNWNDKAGKFLWFCTFF